MKRYDPRDRLLIAIAIIAVVAGGAGSGGVLVNRGGEKGLRAQRSVLLCFNSLSPIK